MAVSSTTLQLFIAVVVVFGSVASAEAAAGADEVRVLMEFKQGLVDDLGHLESWKASDPSPCSWVGVACARDGTVVDLRLGSMNLSGQVSGAVCSLVNLTALSLATNEFGGGFPTGLLACHRLEWLELQTNQFQGPLPGNISALSSIRYLDLSNNVFTGVIPPGIADLSQLRNLSFWNNRLVGPVPPQLGRLPVLLNLTLSYNNFGPVLPEELSNITSLNSFRCGGCALVGNIPTWLGRLSNLEFLELSYNALNGPLPVELTGLSKLRLLELYSNSISGPIPREIGLLSSLTDIDLNSNLITGTIPDELANIKSLRVVHLWNNSLQGEIPRGLAELPNLTELSLFINMLSGTIPADLGTRCHLEMFDVSTNNLTGNIPSSLCNGGKLWRFILFGNDLSGSIPEQYGSCSSLVRMRIQNNRFTGPLPSGIWGLPSLSILEVSGNLFEGGIGEELGRASSLRTLRVLDNRFTGPIPSSIGKLANLNEFTASGNMLNGGIPPQLGQCSGLASLYLDGNQLEGQIPQEVGQLSRLQSLNLAGNRLSGPVPGGLGSLSNLIWFDLSNNSLSGRIPPELNQLQLSKFIHFNMSYNQLTGPVPFDVGIFDTSLLGNDGICLGTGSNRCDLRSLGNSKRKGAGALAWSAGVVLAVAAMASFVGSYCFYLRYKAMVNKEKLDGSRRDLDWTMTPFQKLGFSLEDVLASLDEDNVIGCGGAGKVYKASLKDGHALAVKKLWPTGTKDGKRSDYGFRAEVESLGRIRHFNIVKLLCCCSNGETNILVYDFVPNGSLGDLLHGTKASALDWPTRYRVALGAAQGLSYLHHDCVPQILHRDVKSNNILLNEEFDGMLADFGLAKLLDDEEDGYSVSYLTGSLGYIAPEYAHKLKVNEKSDIYSYGVVLLELLTGKRPVDDGFGGEGIDIVTWVCAKIQSREDVISVFDSRIVGASPRELMLVLKIALHCTSEVPSSRPSMREVVQMLKNLDPNSSYSSSKELDVKVVQPEV